MPHHRRSSEQTSALRDSELGCTPVIQSGNVSAFSSLPDCTHVWAWKQPSQTSLSIRTVTAYLRRTRTARKRSPAAGNLVALMPRVGSRRHSIGRGQDAPVTRTASMGPSIGLGPLDWLYTAIVRPQQAQNGSRRAAVARLSAGSAASLPE